MLTLAQAVILTRLTSPQVKNIVLQEQKEQVMTTEQLKLFYKILETKNSWGKNEIRQVLLEVVSGIRTEV